MVKVNATLGLTLCTNESSRNFLRLGLDVTEIDTALDVDAQIEGGITVGVKALHRMDDQLLEEVSDIIAVHQGDAPRLRDEIAATKEQLAHVREKLIPDIIEKVKELVARVEKGEEIAAVESVDALGAEVEVKAEKAEKPKGNGRKKNGK